MTKSIIKRRELLGALGAAGFLATPVFRETLAEAQGSAFPLRFVVLTIPGGVYYPTDTILGGGNFKLDKSLAPFAPLQSEMVFFENSINGTQGDIGSARNDPHGGGMLSLLTGADGGTSIDQMLAGSLGSSVKFSSLQFGVFTAAEGAGGRTYVFNNGSAIQPVDEPATMFSRLFGGGPPAPPPTPTGTVAPPPPVATGDGGRRQSLLDQVKSEVEAIKRIAGAKEQAKLDQHLTSLRELEKQIPTTATGGTIPGGSTVPFNPSVGCAAPTLNQAANDIPAILGQQLDLLYSALACDLSRVCSLQILRSGQSSLHFPWLGVDADHHGLEHEKEDPKLGLMLDKVQNYFFAQFATLVNRMKATAEGNGSSMLDNTLVLLTSELANAEQHSAGPMIWCSIGRAGGRVRAGRSIDYAGNDSSNTLLSIANTLDPSIQKVGGSSGGIVSLG